MSTMIRKTQNSRPCPYAMSLLSHPQIWKVHDIFHSLVDALSKLPHGGFVLQHETFGFYAECNPGREPIFETKRCSGRLNLNIDLFLFGQGVNTAAIFKMIDELDISNIFVSYKTYDKAWLRAAGEWERM